MADVLDRILELTPKGFSCSQMVALMVLEAAGESNPGFIRGLDGVGGGIGYTGKSCCGCLSGACCAISYFTGVGEEQEKDQENFMPAMKEMVDWFMERTKAEYGSCNCLEMLGGSFANMYEQCPPLIMETYEKCMEILEERGIITW